MRAQQHGSVSSSAGNTEERWKGLRNPSPVAHALPRAFLLTWKANLFVATASSQTWWLHRACKIHISQGSEGNAGPCVTEKTLCFVTSLPVGSTFNSWLPLFLRAPALCCSTGGAPTLSGGKGCPENPPPCCLCSLCYLQVFVSDAAL